MAGRNKINNATQDLIIDPGAAGDSFVQFDINATGEFRIGVDDDAADAFKISQSSALGTKDTFIMTASGQRSMPLQPAFLAYNSTTDSNVTGDNTTIDPVEFDTEVFDVGGNYDNATDLFTVPVTGRYFFFVSMRLEGFDGTQNSMTCNLIPGGGQIFSFFVCNPANLTAGGVMAFNGSCVVSLVAAQTARITLRSGPGGGNKSVDIHGGADRLTVFGGYLLV